MVKFSITWHDSQVPWNWGEGRPNSPVGVDRTPVHWAVPEFHDFPMVRPTQLSASSLPIKRHPAGTFLSP